MATYDRGWRSSYEKHQIQAYFGATSVLSCTISLDFDRHATSGTFTMWCDARFLIQLTSTFIRYRTTCQNFGHCSTLSCQRFSRVSRHLKTGSTRHSLIKVSKTRSIWMKKNSCLSLSVCTRCYDHSCSVVSKRMLKLSFLTRWNVSSNANCQHCNSSYINKWRKTAECTPLWAKKGKC